MSVYIVFFGKSQDFTASYYDRNSPIHDFNSVIKDFDLLESKIFTVDDIKNKEILSRYFFTSQGNNYCLLKLYSFAQAYSGNRIAGSIYGVGLLSDKEIQFSKDNLELLRAAKDNFSKLSLNGAKFNKSNFKEDTDRIWKAIVSSKDGNLIDKVSTSSLRVNKSGDSVAFYVKDLFGDAVKLNSRVSTQDTVYLSEDLEHLKRTQSKWGKGTFPVYWEQNNQYVPYIEPVPPPQSQNTSGQIPTAHLAVKDITDPAIIKAELADLSYNNRNLQQDIERMAQKQKLLMYTIYGLSALTILLLLYILFFSSTRDQTEVKETATNYNSSSPAVPSDPISVFLIDGNAIDSGIVFLKSAQFISKFDVTKSFSDSAAFHAQYSIVQNIATSNRLSIDYINAVYSSKCNELNKITVSKKSVAAPVQLSTKSEKKKGN